MTKQTAATRHADAHLKRRADRLENRKMPRFNEHLMPQHGVVVIADCDGELIRVDCDNGSIRRLGWEQ